MCCCTRLHRHQIHLISYGIVSCGLIMTGLVFTVFAIFQKESQIGKVWLAGPTTMVVGLVLAGKVIIDWGPAMLHGREGSIDSQFFEQMNMPNSQFHPEPTRQPQFRIEHEPKCNGAASHRYVQSNNNTGIHFPAGYRPPMQYLHSPESENGMPRLPGGLPRSSIGCLPSHSVDHTISPDNCLVYSHYNSSLNKLTFRDDRCYSIPRHINNIKSSPRSQRSPRASLHNTFSNHSNPSNNSGHSGEQSLALSDTCECTQYGSMRRGPSLIPNGQNDNPPYQGESFVLNERSYLI
ncbi:unnamed protein product [Caenorhabditis bovis]|uniref:Uncharacterized protein n=1 Tax=Caenorhabditis bovis TaxID=2654633 RepID=A0A8S1ES06_9PELO|nr:unnamed protein product [Caenorhabditis bovis]